MLFIFQLSDCFPTDALFNPTEFPAWSPCLAFKNESNKCGEGPTAPFAPYAPADIYGAILMKDRWVSHLIIFYTYVFKFFLDN